MTRITKAEKRSLYDHPQCDCDPGDPVLYKTGTFCDNCGGIIDLIVEPVKPHKEKEGYQGLFDPSPDGDAP